MKVLEKGPGWSLECICTGSGNGDGGCGSKLLVEKDDIFLTSSSCYDGSTDYYYTFECPECHEKTDIEEIKVPRAIRERLLAKERERVNNLQNSHKRLTYGGNG